MLSNKPYLLRAFNEWIMDSACTPILVLDATNPRCKIPKDFAENGEIVFNISPSAIRDLKLMNESVEFKASFSGVIHLISAPINAVLAIYAEENGEGLYFDSEEEGSGTGDASMHLKNVDSAASVVEKTAKIRPFLTLVE